MSIALIPDFSAERVPWLRALRSLDARWTEYRSSPVDMTVSPVDDMIGKAGLEYYEVVGLSALEIISEAMLLARREDFPDILDLPCGGGRVTRQLVRFFPESTIYVCDAEKPKEDFVASHFKLPRFEAPIDFKGTPARQVDLIFVGSLLTHLDQDLFAAAVNYFIDALKVNGVLVATFHGRHRARVSTTNQRSAAAKSPTKTAPRPELLQNLEGKFLREGFCFGAHSRVGSIIYGTSFSAPSWVLRLVEARPDAQILGVKERGWARNQDVLILQKIGA